MPPLAASCWGSGEPSSELVDQGLSLPASEQLPQLIGGEANRTADGGERSGRPRTVAMSWDADEVAVRVAHHVIILRLVREVLLTSPGLQAGSPAA